MNGRGRGSPSTSHSPDTHTLYGESMPRTRIRGRCPGVVWAAERTAPQPAGTGWGADRPCLVRYDQYPNAIAHPVPAGDR